MPAAVVPSPGPRRSPGAADSSRLCVDRWMARGVPVGHALRRGRGRGEAEPGRGGSHRARAQVFRARAERVGPGDRDARGRGRAAATGGVPGGRAHGDDRGTGEHGVHLTRAWSGLCRVKMRRRTRQPWLSNRPLCDASWLDKFPRLIVRQTKLDFLRRCAEGVFLQAEAGSRSSAFTWSCSCPASYASCVCACSSSSRA